MLPVAVLLGVGSVGAFVGCGGGSATLGPEGGAGSSGGSAGAAPDASGAAGGASDGSAQPDVGGTAGTASGDGGQDVDATSPSDGAVDGAADSAPTDASATTATWCGRGVDVPGAVPASGFCLKQYARVAEARAMVVAPTGDLFVSAPAAATPGGASGGPGAIVLLSDDDDDGVAEAHAFLSGIQDVHGLALGGGYLYFTTQKSVFRTPYTDGQRVAAGAPEDLGLPQGYASGGRWTHGLARSAGGQLITSRGAYATCGSTTGGEISTVGTGGALTTMASGFRNPMYLRCHRSADVCAAMELGEDLAIGAHEKMIMLRPNTYYGFPCCYTKSAPVPNSAANSMCGDVTEEEATFPLSDTPFGFDWEPGGWPAPYKNGIFVALHGSAYSSPSWQGAAVVYAATNPTTHMPTQDWQPFQTGFGPSGSALERPADIAFSSDGRMFIADDQSGRVYWMAPLTLAAPSQ
jgi:glucose/arabinose dehydrogenase